MVAFNLMVYAGLHSTTASNAQLMNSTIPVLIVLLSAMLLGNATAIAAMLYVGVAASLLANLLYMFGIVRVGPGRAGMFIHLVPLYGAIISIAVLGESMHLYHALGMAAIMAGLACSSMADKHRFEWLRRTGQKTTGAFR